MPETKRLVEGSAGGGLFGTFVGCEANGKFKDSVENSPLSTRGPTAGIVAADLINIGFKLFYQNLPTNKYIYRVFAKEEQDGNFGESEFRVGRGPNY